MKKLLQLSIVHGLGEIGKIKVGWIFAWFTRLTTSHVLLGVSTEMVEPLERRHFSISGLIWTPVVDSSKRGGGGILPLK